MSRSLWIPRWMTDGSKGGILIEAAIDGHPDRVDADFQSPRRPRILSRVPRPSIEHRPTEGGTEMTRNVTATGARISRRQVLVALIATALQATSQQVSALSLADLSQ